MSHAPGLKPHDHVYLIDGSGYIFRAYHALPPLTRKSDGLPVGAVQGFCNMLWKLLEEMRASEAPTHLAVIFDYSGRSFRNDYYPEYKAHRPEPPADLRPQFGLIRQATRAFNVACVEMENYEADDLIATYARQAVEAGATCRIVSSDKDLMQLIRPGVSLYDTMKDREVGAPEVLEKFGVTPDKVIDVQALAGDSVDNVPGVPGIGLKTGAQLITEYGDLETLLARAADIKQQKRRENLIAFADQARISKRLVTLDAHVPVTQHIASFAVDVPRASELIGFAKALEFTSFTRKVATALGADAAAIDPVPVTVKYWPPEPPAGGEAAAADAPPAAPVRAARPARSSPPEAAKPRSATPIAAGRYQLISSEESLAQWLTGVSDAYRLAVTVMADDGDPLRAEIAGFALALDEARVAYVPVAHRSSGDGMFGGERLEGQMDLAPALALLKPHLESPAVLKVGHDVKRDIALLARHGVALAAQDDVMLLSYAIESGLTGHGLAALADRHLRHGMADLKAVLGSGRSAVSFGRVPLEAARAVAGEMADVALRLWHLLKRKAVEAHKLTVYETLERPLVPVLAAMEQAGILVDPDLLKTLSNDFAITARRIEGEIHGLAGESFNIGSPKQLGDILFGKMGLPGGKKTATGAWSTDAETLEDLAAQGVDMARKVVDWRQVVKLMSTYTDALPAYIHPETGRVHTSYQLAATSTGRLSSTDPNLQNIPIRTEEGRKIRRAFVAPKGHQLISADYSQIELRVFAHVADIPQLKTAFAEGQDIHAMTASEMFGVPVKGMPAEVRRRAKAINFGIIYGISAFGLANQLGIGREEAGNYIKTYFARFPGIRDYMEATKKQAHELGYVETLFGRRCHVPRINASNPSERANAERAAINAPIQGAAADIIRRAMIRMPAALAAESLSARMLLQVHDELVFEAPDGEVEAAIRVARAVMEKAAEPAVKLSVPLAVDGRAARNWDEAH